MNYVRTISMEENTLFNKKKQRIQIISSESVWSPNPEFFSFFSSLVN